MRLSELVYDVRRRLVEALGGSLLGDRGGPINNNDDLGIGYRPITERARGKKTRDLSLLSHREMIDVALYLYGSNALAEWLVDMPTALVVGQELGYAIAINEEQAAKSGNAPANAEQLKADIRKVLDKFWYHPAHNLSEKAGEYAHTFLVTGHLLLPITTVNDVDGVPQLDLIDAAQITGVIPKNGSAIVPGIVKFTPVDSAADTKEHGYVVVQRNVDGALLPGSSDAAPEDVPEAAGVTLDGEALYFRHNKLLNQMRGVSYLMPVADWLDALDAFTWATLDRGKLRNSIVWHLRLEGVSDDAVLQKRTNDLMAQLANPGSVYASNEKASLEAKNAELGTADSVELGRFILTHILGSKGFPESWYSQGGNANRATAAEQTDVAYKALLQLQTRLKGIFRTILWMAYDSMQAKQQGKYPLRSESPWLSIEPTMPVVQERDLSRLAASCAQLATGLEGAIAAKLISEQTSRRTFLEVLGQISGGAYEADEEESKIEGETAEREQRDQARQQELARAGFEKALGDNPPPPPKPAAGGVPPEGAAA